MLAGTWIFISGFVSSTVVPVNYIIMGVIVAIFGFWNPRKEWQGILNGILGLWLIISGFVPQLVTPANLWVIGIAVGVLASSRLWTKPHHHAAA